MKYYFYKMKLYCISVDIILDITLLKDLLFAKVNTI